MSRTPARVTQADLARSIRAGETFIYFLRAGQFIKIGQSKRWKERLAQMQPGSPHIIIPLLVLIAEPGLEKKLHARFRVDHFRGEWFHSGPALAAYIKENLSRCVAKSDAEDLRMTSELLERAPL